VGQLLLVSLVWAFSFGLIKGNLAGLDSSLVSAIRMAISLAVFLPLFRPAGLDGRRAAAALAIGGVQFGLMYLAYIYSFRFLQAYEVALLTITTPLYVTAAHDLLVRRVNLRYLASALLAVLGAAAVVATSRQLPEALAGIAAVQASNLCFAAGQVAYARMLGPDLRDPPARHFALLYAGAAAVTGLAAAASVDWSRVAITPAQWLTLGYLGAVASGLCFFLWNAAAPTVNPGVLAVFNNVKIPLAVLCSLVFFGERADPLRLAAGGGLMAAALWLAAAGGAAGRRGARALPGPGSPRLAGRGAGGAGLRGQA